MGQGGHVPVVAPGHGFGHAQGVEDGFFGGFDNGLKNRVEALVAQGGEGILRGAVARDAMGGGKG